MPNGNKVPFMAILAIALVVILGITMFSGIVPAVHLRQKFHMTSFWTGWMQGISRA